MLGVRFVVDTTFVIENTVREDQSVLIMFIKHCIRKRYIWNC